MKKILQRDISDFLIKTSVGIVTLTILGRSEYIYIFFINHSQRLTSALNTNILVYMVCLVLDMQGKY